MEISRNGNSGKKGGKSMRTAEEEIWLTYHMVYLFLGKGAAIAMIEFYAFGVDNKNWNNLLAQYVRACIHSGKKQGKKGHRKFVVTWIKINAMTDRVWISFDAVQENISLSAQATEEKRKAAIKIAKEMGITRIEQTPMEEAYQQGTLESKKLTKIVNKLTRKSGFRKTIEDDETRVVKVLAKYKMI